MDFNLLAAQTDGDYYSMIRNSHLTAEEINRGTFMKKCPA